MKTLIKLFTVSVLLTVFFLSPAVAQVSQNREMQYFKPSDKRGLNVFETTKDNSIGFTKLKVILGGSSTLQYQGINHSNSALFFDNGSGVNVNELKELGSNFNLATANFDLDIQLHNGLRMHLRTYLSSRHHHEPYVKSGYLQVDRLDFVREGFLDNVMDMITLKIGHMENNYGDAHFRRSDNAMSLHNPFIGNYIMDSFTTEVGAEAYLKKNGFIGMIGFSNGKLNQDVENPGATDLAFIGKLGFDKQTNPDLRVRLTGSIYSIGKAKSIYLYSADRAGSRYYSVMKGITATSDNFRSGRWNPNFSDKLTAIMINPFIKYKGLEFFGTYENSQGGDFKNSSETRTWNQVAGEVIYRFGNFEQWYGGIRYNSASGKLANADPNEVSIDRIQMTFGWFLTDNVVAKIEYVNQSYNDFAKNSIYSEGNFKGFMAEAAIGF